MKKFETPVIKIAEFSKENIATTASLTAVGQANADATAVMTTPNSVTEWGTAPAAAEVLSITF